jgi:hypothetical protein
MELEGSLPCYQDLNSWPYTLYREKPSPKPLVTFRNALKNDCDDGGSNTSETSVNICQTIWLNFQENVSSYWSWESEINPIQAFHDCLFDIFAATLLTHPEAVSSTRSLRKSNASKTSLRNWSLPIMLKIIQCFGIKDWSHGISAWEINPFGIVLEVTTRLILSETQN